MLSSHSTTARQEQKNDELQPTPKPQRNKRKKSSESVTTVDESGSTASRTKKPTLAATVTALEASLSNVRSEAMAYETRMNQQIAQLKMLLDQGKNQITGLTKRIGLAESEIAGAAAGLVNLHAHVIRQEAHITRLQTLVMVDLGLKLTEQNPFSPNMQSSAMPQRHFSQQPTQYVPHQPQAPLMHHSSSNLPQSQSSSPLSAYTQLGQLFFNNNNSNNHRPQFPGLSNTPTQAVPLSSSTGSFSQPPPFMLGGSRSSS